MANDFLFYRGSNYLALPRDPQPWIIDGLIPIGLTNEYGKPKLGKSFLSLGIAEAVSNPERNEFLGRKVCKHGPVLYLQIDTPRVEWALRIERMKVNGYNIENIHFADANLIPYPIDITQAEIKEGLKEAITRCTPRPVLLIVDTLREVHPGDEDKSSVMKEVITGLQQATMETQTSLLLISHSRKGGFESKEDEIMDDNRGSGYVSGKMDMIMKLTNKGIHLQGRSIGKTRIDIEQDSIGMFHLDKEKAGNEAALKFVLSQANLKTDVQRAEMLAAMENIEQEAARNRIRYYRKKMEETKT